MIKWGIMATGTIAEKFAKTLNDMNDNENILTAVASRSTDKAKNFAEKYKASEYYGSYEEMCLSDNVDAVYVCTPNNMHYENCMLALSKGKHVLCEKPFTTSAKEAEKLYRSAESKGLFIMEGLWIYHLPLLKKTVDIVKSGAIGDVVSIRADYGFTANGARRERKFLSELGGGALLDVGVYNVGFANMIYGSSPADVQTKCILNEYGTDMYGIVLAEYSGNRFATLTSSIGIKMETEGVIYGTLGRIYFPNYQKAEKMCIIYNDGREEKYEMPFEYGGFEYQIRESQKCIQEGKTESKFYTHKQSIEIMRTLETVRNKWGMKFSFE